MSHVGVESSRGGRRPVDGEVNMIPMIDLLVCCISFLLITAVWSHLSRLRADAQVPGSTEGIISPHPPEKVLHVEMHQEDEFRLSWKQGPTVISVASVPRHAIQVKESSAGTIRYPDLATMLVDEWRANGSHRDPSDKQRDQVVLHADDRTTFKEMIAVMDAIAMPKRNARDGRPTQAFNLSLSKD